MNLPGNDCCSLAGQEYRESCYQGLSWPFRRCGGTIQRGPFFVFPLLPPDGDSGRGLCDGSGNPRSRKFGPFPRRRAVGHDAGNSCCHVLFFGKLE